MSEDQNTTNSCLNCKSQFKRDRICISKQCSDQEYLKYICKMCHYEEHKSQGRLKLSELEIDIFKKDIEDLIETQMNQDQEEQKLYNNSKLIREKIKESIKCLENFDKQLEEFENEYITLHEKLKKAFNGLKKQDNEELQQSIYNIFERVQLCESDDNSKTVGFWKIQRSCQEDKLVQVSSSDVCNNCMPQYRQNRDPEGTSIFYYYSHEKSSTWIKTRNAQDIYNYYQKMLGTINENNQQLNNYAKSQDTK